MSIANSVAPRYIDMTMKKDFVLPADNLISCFGEAQDCVKAIDTDAMLMSFNDNGYKIMEIDDPKSVIGKNWLDFWTGEMAPRAREAFARAKRGQLGTFEGFCPTFKDSPKWWHVTIVPLKDDRGDIQ